MFKAGDMDIAVWREMVSEGGPYNTDLTTSTNIGANPWTGKAGNYVVQTDEADTVSMGVDVTGKAGMGNFGLRFISTTSEAAAADASGSEIDAYYNGKIGPGMLIASYVNQSGDLNEDGDGDARQGMYIHWIQKFGGITGEVGLVQSNSFKADDHFALFSTVGTSQDTAVMNFGAGPMGAGTMKELQVLAAKASMMATPKTKVTVGLGMASGKVVDGADSGSGNAVDLIVTHKIRAPRLMPLTVPSPWMKIFQVWVMMSS